MEEAHTHMCLDTHRHICVHSHALQILAQILRDEKEMRSLMCPVSLWKMRAQHPGRSSGKINPEHLQLLVGRRNLNPCSAETKVLSKGVTMGGLFV